MPNVNIVIIAGFLTRDPEMRYTPKGSAVAQGGIAVIAHGKPRPARQGRK
jgi:single-stranded DNA-binding protein